MRVGVWLLALWWAGAQESNVIGENEDAASCICDLTAASCDLYCCCDADCDATLVQTWDDVKQSRNLCVAEKLSTWGQQYCVKKDGEYIENGVKGAEFVRDTVNTLLCVEIDNSPDLGRFYDVIDPNLISDDTVSNREEEIVDYADTMTATKDYSPGSTFQTGDFLISYVNQLTQPNLRWPLPSPDESGACSNSNPVRWLMNQDLPPCVRPNNNCGGPLDPATYTTFLTIRPIPQLLGVVTPVPVKVQTVTELRLNGVMQNIVNPVIGSSGSSCLCSGILYEAHYTVVTDSAQQTINSVYADIVIGNTQSCIQVAQRFSLKYVTAEGTFPRSGNPGYIEGKPLLVKLATGTTLNVFQLGGVESNGACAQFPTSLDTITEYLIRSSPTVSFRSELIFSCYMDLTFTALQRFCAPDASNANAILFQNLPQYVAKFGNPEYSNVDDFVQLLQPTAVNNKWNDVTGECTLQHTLVIEFVTAEVGVSSNPQPKIIYARAYFRDNTKWKFKQRDKSYIQRFFNTVIVTFVRYEESTDPYKPVDPTTQDALIDDVIYPWKANTAERVAGALLGCVLLLA